MRRSRAATKVYMIDEVHMLTGHAFNAMLEDPEEPPSTSSSSSRPPTRRRSWSRCCRAAQFNLKQMPPGHIVGHHAAASEAEAVPSSRARCATSPRPPTGSMRDALSLLDQAIAHGAGKVEEQAVQ